MVGDFTLTNNLCGGGGSFPLSSSEMKEGIQEGGLSLSRCTGLGKKPFPGLVNFVAAVAYHFCLSLPAAFTQPGVNLLA